MSWNAKEYQLCFFFNEKKGVFEISNISFKDLREDVDIENLDADLVHNPCFRVEEYNYDWLDNTTRRIENLRKSQPSNQVC